MDKGKRNILQEINQAALRFLEPLTPDQTYSVIIDEASKLTYGEMGFIALEKDGRLDIVYVSDKRLNDFKIRQNGFTYKSYIKRKVFVIHHDEYLKAHPEIIKMGINSVLLIPLFYEDKSLGAMAISMKRDVIFTPHEYHILKLFGLMSILAIRKAQLYEETKQALESRDTFLSMAAHEFRTPITTINGYAQMIQKKLSGQNSAESKWVDYLVWESKRLSNLVNELLEISRIKSGSLSYFWKVCSVRDIIKRALADFYVVHPIHKAVFIDKSLEGDEIIGDYDKILQVLTNLLDNASKFSPADKDIVITFKSASSNYIIEIKDEGIGISRTDLKELFKKYYRGTSHTKEGIGLGLYICREIIRHHKGDIKFESQINKGTKVILSLPKYSQ